jgi:hypothetical protein
LTLLFSAVLFHLYSSRFLPAGQKSGRIKRYTLLPQANQAAEDANA